MVYTCLWLAFNGSRNVSLHLNGFQPYKVILMYQACKQASKKTDFTVDPIWWGSLWLAPTSDNSYNIEIMQYTVYSSAKNSWFAVCHSN